MSALFVILVSLSAANEAFAPRLETLSFHIDRLETITIAQGLEEEKAAKIAALRAQVAAGAENEEAFQAIYYAIDAVRMWLWETAAEQPQCAPGTYSEEESAWIVETPDLRLLVQKADGTMQVKQGEQVWNFAPCDRKDIKFKGKSLALTQAQQVTAEAFHTGYGVGMSLALSDFPGAEGFALRLTAQCIGNEIVFDLAATDIDKELQCIKWPKPLVTGNTAADMAVIPRMQGMLVPGDWPQEIHAEDLCNSRSFYLPWWGSIQQGCGVQVILETSDDAGGYYHHKAGEATEIGPKWYASLGKLRYLRSIRYIFSEKADHVSMAKRYRRFVKERGHFVSLREKLLRTPALSEVIGKPVVHMGALYHFVQEASLFNKDRIEANHSLRTFAQLAADLRTLKDKGIEHAYVHLDGWGFYGYDNGHPNVLPVGQEQGGWEGLRDFSKTCRELGYLFAVHDQYRDFYLNAVSFDDRLTVTRLDGSREEHSVWCGGPQTILSPRFSPENVRRNHDLFAAHGVEVRGAYLDVFAVVPLEESAQPTQPVSRSDCARYRKECFDLLRARGYVVSSEEPADYLVPSLDLVHHGPYATYPNIGGGDACGIPVPLFNLVYHESILLPWEMGDAGGWGVPKSDAAWLHCVLNAGLPYVSAGYDDKKMAMVKEFAALAQHAAHLEMTKHEFIEDSWRMQRATYSDGTQVTVNFDTKEYKIEYPAKKAATPSS